MRCSKSPPYPNADTVVVLSTLAAAARRSSGVAGYAYFFGRAWHASSRTAGCSFSVYKRVLQARVAVAGPAAQARGLGRRRDRESSIAPPPPTPCSVGTRGARCSPSCRSDSARHARQSTTSEACLSRRAEFPCESGSRHLPRARRGVSRARRVTRAHARCSCGPVSTTLGRRRRCARAQRRVSVDPTHGFRFSEKRLVHEAEGVCNDGIRLRLNISVHRRNATRSSRSTRARPSRARAATRWPHSEQSSQAPISKRDSDRMVIGTTWAASPRVREPGSTVIAEANFPAGACAQSAIPSAISSDFFGTENQSA